MDLRQGREYGNWMERRGWKVLDVGGRGDKMKIFLKKLPCLPFFVLKIQRYKGEIDLKKTREIKRKYWVIYTVLEPLENIGEIKGFKLNKGPFLPTKTLVVNLSKSEKSLLEGFKKDTRQQLKKQSNWEIKTNLKLEVFRDEWQKAYKGYLPKIKELRDMKKSFGKKMLVMGIKKGNELVAGMIVLLCEETVYYYFAWTNERGRKLSAQYHLVWEGMKRLKKEGYKWWDFEGIEDERFPRKSWSGFSEFKKKFGGSEISFPGSWHRFL